MPTFTVRAKTHSDRQLANMLKTALAKATAMVAVHNQDGYGRLIRCHRE
jgi:hypothetical protein